jgi:hypothetical protein
MVIGPSKTAHLINANDMHRRTRTVFQPVPLVAIILFIRLFSA